MTNCHKNKPIDNISKAELDTILHTCRQCGSCCKRYQKILLQDDEVDYIKQMGGHVGVRIKLDDLRTNTIDKLIANEKLKDRVYMIHPDGKGCVFLQKNDGKYSCKIYNNRPKTCQRFNCNFADNTVNEILLKDPFLLLGIDGLGNKLSPT